jgi:hypothetical protein
MRDALLDPCHRAATNWSAIISFILLAAGAFLLIAVRLV